MPARDVPGFAPCKQATFRAHRIDFRQGMANHSTIWKALPKRRPHPAYEASGEPYVMVWMHCRATKGNIWPGRVNWRGSATFQPKLPRPNNRYRPGPKVAVVAQLLQQMVGVLRSVTNSARATVMKWVCRATSTT